MKNKILIFFLLLNLFGTNCVLAQKNDLLKSTLDKINELNNKQEVHKAIEQSVILFNQAKEANNIHYQIIALNKKSNLEIEINDFNAAFLDNEAAINLLQKEKDDNFLFTLFNLKIKIFIKTNNFDNAAYYLIKAKKIIKNDTSSNNWVVYYNSLSNFYYHSNDFTNAIKSFKLASDLYKKLDNKFYYRGTFDNIGLCYRNLKNYDSAEFYFKKAIEISQSDNSIKGEINALLNLSKTYYLKKIYNKAIEYGNEVNRKVNILEFKNNYSIENAINFGNIYLDLKLINKTDSVLKEIKKIIESNYTPLKFYYSTTNWFIKSISITMKLDLIFKLMKFI